MCLDSMIMEKTNMQLICSRLCSNVGTFILLITFLLVLQFSFSFLSPTSKSFPFLLTVPIALLSTFFLFVTLTKKKGFQVENLVKEEPQKEDLPQPSYVTHTEVNQQSEAVENQEQLAEAHSDYSFPSDSESSNFSIMENRTFELNVQEHKLQEDLESDSSLPSDSESSICSIIEESFEIDQNGDQNLDGSHESDFGGDDDEDTDNEEEDSLIEINLPRNHFSELNEDTKHKLESKLPDFLQDTIFKQQGLMELLAEINEMNEDENLIEIDISMGSTTNSPHSKLKQEFAYFGDECVISD